ncbi:MAG: D-ribose pyranase [Chthoniobacterales bacterium]
MAGIRISTRARLSPPENGDYATPQCPRRSSIAKDHDRGGDPARHLGLSQAIAAMGHGDLLIVCDAGFPIPSEVPRIDLAVIPDLPDIETVLTAINREFIAEKVAYAAEMAQNNPRLKEKVDRIFAGAELISVSHADILGPLSHKAKFIVRAGAFDPWGNILLYSGVDVKQWFTKPGTVVPDYYQARMK